MFALLLLACGAPAKPTATARSPRLAFHSQPATAAPLTSLRIYAPLLSTSRANPVSAPLYNAFTASLIQRLAMCRVTAQLVTAPPAATDISLSIRAVDHQITEVRMMSQGVQVGTFYRGAVDFALELAGPGAPLWWARASFAFTHAPEPDPAIDEVTGTALARDLVTQLQHDGALTTCVREAYPGCSIDRVEQRARANRMTDKLARFQALHDLPVCDSASPSPH